MAIAFIHVEAQSFGSPGTKPGTTDVGGGKIVVIAYPNPSFGEFHLALQSPDKVSPFTIRLINARGKIVEVMKTSSFVNEVRLGGSLKPGTYYADIIQGQKKAFARLFKM